MTDQEKQLITQVADQIKNAPAPQIDRDAYDLILHTIGTRPDALYVLTQTVIIQQMALEQAKQQIDQLQRQTPPPVPQQQGSFLPQSQQAPYQGGYQGSGYAGQGYDATPPQAGGRFSNFLHNAATTAAGVIAGEVAFDALSSIFGHHGGYGGGGFLGGGIMPGSETIVNNYYGDDRGFGQGGDSGSSRFADAASQDQGISPDIDDERDNSGDAFASGDDSADNMDDSGDNFDDSSNDSGDDSGSSDF